MPHDAAHDPLRDQEADDQRECPRFVPEIAALGLERLRRRWRHALPAPGRSPRPARTAHPTAAPAAAGILRSAADRRTRDRCRRHRTIGRRRRASVAAAPRFGAARDTSPAVSAAIDGGVLPGARWPQRQRRRVPRLAPSASPRPSRPRPARTPRRVSRAARRSSRPSAGAVRHAERHRIGRIARQPARGLPPEELVAAIGGRPQHAPAPRRLAGEDHRAAAAVALNRDQRHRRAVRPTASPPAPSRRAADRRPANSTRAAAAPPTASATPPAWRAMRMIGWSAPSGVSVTDVVRRRRPRDPPARVGAPPRRSFSSTGSTSSSGDPAMPALQKRPPAEHQQTAATHADEVGEQFHLRAPEELALEVADDHRVVGEQRFARRRETRTSARRRDRRPPG